MSLLSLLYGLLSGLAWAVVSALGALSPTEMTNVVAVGRRWLARIEQALWPEVRS